MKIRGRSQLGALVCVFALLCGAFFSAAANASMQLDRTQVVFKPEAGREDVVVSNAGEEPLYVKVEVLEVTAPGTERERRVVVENPEDIGLIATPPRFVVQPGKRKILRLVNLLGHGAAETVYRVNVVPVAPPVASEGIGVRVLIAYQLLIFVRPQNPVFDVAARREETQLIVENRGNTNFILRDIEHCPDDGKPCSKLAGKRVYAGNTITLPVPAGGHLTLNAVGEGETRKLAF